MPSTFRVTTILVAIAATGTLALACADSGDAMPPYEAYGSMATALIAQTLVPGEPHENRPASEPSTWIAELDVDLPTLSAAVRVDDDATDGVDVGALELTLQKKTFDAQSPTFSVLVGDADGEPRVQAHKIPLTGHVGVSATIRTLAFGPSMILDGALVVDLDPNSDGVDRHAALSHIAGLLAGDLSTFAGWADDVRVTFVGTLSLDVGDEAGPAEPLFRGTELPVARVAALFDSRAAPETLAPGAMHTAGLHVTVDDIANPIPYKWFGVGLDVPSRFDVDAWYVDENRWRVQAQTATQMDQVGGYSVDLELTPAELMADARINTDLGIFGARGTLDPDDGAGELCTRLSPEPDERPATTAGDANEVVAMVDPSARFEALQVCVDHNGFGALAAATVDWGVDPKLAGLLDSLAGIDLSEVQTVALELLPSGELDMSARIAD